jgi:hypothetical protein
MRQGLILRCTRLAHTSQKTKRPAKKLASSKKMHAFTKMIHAAGVEALTLYEVLTKKDSAEHEY